MKKNPEQLLIKWRENAFLIQSQLIIFSCKMFQHLPPAKCPDFQGTKDVEFLERVGGTLI